MKKPRQRGLIVGIGLGLIAGVVVAVLATGHSATSGVFTAKCKVAKVGFIDPIVSPGVSSAHEHTLFGPTTISPDSTYASMTSSPTTCKVTVGTQTFTDTAAYWQPTLLKPDGTRVPVAGQTFYYRDKPDTGTTVTAFPPDLRMVSGFPAPSNHDSIGDSNFPKRPTWGFQCDNTQDPIDVPRDCPGGKLIMVINFPSCWDGVNTDSPDHRSHMAYPTSGSCPASHPVKVPFLYQKVNFNISNCGTIGCYLSSDAGMGVPSLHADFWNTWDQPTLEELVRTVLNS